MKDLPTWWWRYSLPPNREHDLERNLELYAQHGVPEYWMLEPDAETVRALTEPVSIAGVGTYTMERIYSSGGTITTNTIPGLAILVADIFVPPTAKRETSFPTNE